MPLLQPEIASLEVTLYHAAGFSSFSSGKESAQGPARWRRLMVPVSRLRHQSKRLQ